MAIHRVKDGVSEMLEEAPDSDGLSFRLKAELRCIESMTKPMPPVVRHVLDRSLQFLNQSMVTQGRWPKVEKRFDRLAVDGILLRSSFGQCIDKLTGMQLALSRISLKHRV